MIQNYPKTAFRNIKKHKGYSFINIAGLAVGMACCILILLWVQDELSFDRFHENQENLYRIVEELRFTDGHIEYYAVSPRSFAPRLVQDYPEIRNIARFLPGLKVLVQSGGTFFYETNIALADPAFLTMMTFPLSQGESDQALSDPHAVVLSESMAQKYFGEEEPLGQTLIIDGESFRITGVMEDIPANSHIQFDLLVPYTDERRLGYPMSQNILYYTYVQLDPNVNVEEVNEKIRDCGGRYAPNAPAEIILSLQSITRIHLHSHFDWDLPGHGDITYIILFSMIAGFVLLIACINFMNLATARSGKRIREVGMRKVLGAFRGEIIRQFYNEAFFMTLLSLCIALLLVMVALPLFNHITEKTLSLNFVSNWRIFIGIITITALTALIAGSYPAIILSGFQPIKVLKGQLRSGTSGAAFRRTLVIVQFSLSVILIICTLAVLQQIKYMQNRKLGYDKSHVVYLPLDNGVKENVSILKDALSQHAGISAVTAISELPTQIERATDYMHWNGKREDENVLMRFVGVDFHALDVFRFKLTAGRFLSPEFSRDSTEAYLINRTAAKVMRMEEPVGQKFSVWRREGTIVGVIEDFHFMSMHQKIEPLILRFMPGWSNFLCIRIVPEQLDQTLQAIRDTWMSIAPDHPLELQFLDQNYGALYRAEERIGMLFQSFTVFAIGISCLGLFGLAAYAAEQRTKEIGIRKVLGASIRGIVLLLTKEFIKWILVANVIAWPMAWLAMNRWLENYAYRIDLGLATFFTATGLALIIAIVTVSFQAVKTALTNPVDTIRYE